MYIGLRLRESIFKHFLIENIRPCSYENLLEAFQQVQSMDPGISLVEKSKREGSSKASCLYTFIHIYIYIYV